MAIELKEGRSSLNGLTALHPGFDDLHAIDARAIFRAEITDPHSAAIDVERHVSPGHGAIGQTNVASRRLPQQDARRLGTVERKRLALLRALHDGEDERLRDRRGVETGV
jgi:hypothetical protein